MAKINISNVVVKDNPAKFLDPFQFEITFECIENLNDDLEWKIIYVGSAESEAYDQTLDTVVVGPIIAGRHMFVFEADPPNIRKIPPQDVVGVTVVLLTCSYLNQEFIRVGYYVNNEYSDPEMKENPPLEPDFSKLTRNILATCPRVTRFKIDWGDSAAAAANENLPPPLSTPTPLVRDHMEDSLDRDTPLKTLMGHRNISTGKEKEKDEMDTIEQILSEAQSQNSNSQDGEAMQM